MSRTAKRVLPALACLAALGLAVLFFAGELPYKVYAVRTGSMSPAIPSRSAVIVHKGAYRVGQAISYRTPNGVVTHRLIKQLADGRLQTKGDANATEDPYTVRPSDVIGGVVAAPRMVGYWLVYFKNPAGLASLLLTLVLVGLVYSLPSDFVRSKQARQSQSAGGLVSASRDLHAPPALVPIGVSPISDADIRTPGYRSWSQPPTPDRQTPSDSVRLPVLPVEVGQAAVLRGSAVSAAPALRREPTPVSSPASALPVPQSAPAALAASRSSAPAPAVRIRRVGTREERLSAAMAAYLRASSDVEAVALVSVDGFTMAAALPAGMHGDRVAATSAATLGLAERAALELGRGKLSQVVVAGDTGYVLLMAAGDRAVLTASARLDAALGLLLCDMRELAAAVAEILDEEPLPTLV